MRTETKKFGVIGDPIEHSLSPTMHNAVFKEFGLNCEYGAYRVTNNELKEFAESMRTKFIGVNVTIPHKTHIIEYLDELEEHAELIGAVNVIKIMDNGKRTVGYNTDGLGAIKALENSIGTVRNKKIMILGAGGAARAISFEAALKNAEIGIYNRTLGKANILAAEILRKTGNPVDVVSLKDCKDYEVIVNTTPVGMYPNTNQSLLTKKMMNPRQTVMDIVYNPLETKLIKEAKEAGADTVNGIEMFVFQGAEALRIWLGIDPPIETMRRVVRKKLIENERLNQQLTKTKE